MKKQRQGRTKAEIEYENTYFSNVKTNLQTHRQKQYSRQFDDIKYLNFQENYNPVANAQNPSNAYQQQQYQQEYYDKGEDYDQEYDEYDEEEYGEDYNEHQDYNDYQQSEVQPKTTTTEKESNEDLQIQQLKQQFQHFEYVKEQILHILTDHSESLTNKSAAGNKKQNLSQTIKEVYNKFVNKLSNEKGTTGVKKEDLHKYKITMLLNQLYKNNFAFSYNLNFQPSLSNLSSQSQEVISNNQLIARKNVYPYYFTQQEINSLNHFDFSYQSVSNPQHFKNQLKEFLSNEKRLYYINFNLNYNINKQMLEKIDQEELILDLIPSTIFTKIVDLQFDQSNIWSILLTLNCLTSLNNYNVINLSSTSGYRRRGQQSQTADYSNQFELIFDAILQQRALQSLEINQINNFILPFINSLKKTDIGSLYLKSLIVSSSSLKHHTQLFNLLSQLPYLSYYEHSGIYLDSQNCFDNLNSLLGKLSSTRLTIAEVPVQFDYQFDFSNLKYLSLTINILTSELNSQRLENLFISLSKSVHLKHLNLKLMLSYYQRNKKKQNRQRNYDAYEEEEENEEECEEEYEEEEECEDEVEHKGGEILVDNQDNINDFKFFEHLIELQHLKKAEFQLEIGQRVMNSLLVYLKKSKSLKNFTLMSNSSFIDNQMYQVAFQEFDIIQSHNVDLQDIYNIISSNSNLELVHLSMQQYIFKYEKISPEEDFYRFNLQLTNGAVCLGKFNPADFRLNTIQEFVYTNQTSQSDRYKKDIDGILRSLSHSKSIKSIQFSMSYAYDNQYYYQIDDQNLKVFNHLNDLNSLQTLKLQMGFNNEILATLSEFLKKNKSIKNLYLIRGSYVDFNYSDFIKNLTNASSLEKVSFSNFMQISDSQDQETQQKISNNFYNGLIQLIQSKTRKINRIELIQYYLHNKQMKEVLNALLTCASPLVVSFDVNLTAQIKNHYEILQIYNKCLDKKLILDSSQSQLLNNI